MKQFLYINGDSWLGHFTSRVANNQHPLFENMFVINHSISGDGNISIINRTEQALFDLKKIGIIPWVCIGLSEIGRNDVSEFELVRPSVTDDVNKYLQMVAQAEIQLANNVLKDYNSYICNTWVSNTNGAKSIIDFIEQDFSTVNPCYTVSNNIYTWLTDRNHIFKFTKSSFVGAIENKQEFEQLLLANQHVNETLHLNKTTSDLIYQSFFQHVLSQLKINNRQQKS
jgi:hypothetical protein